MLASGVFESEGEGEGQTVRVAGQIKLRMLGDSLVLPETDIFTADDPYALDLTPRGMTEAHQTPIVCGDDYNLRLCARTADDVAALDLTGALILMTVRKTDRAPAALFSRRSDTEISSGVLQVVIDDQAEDLGPAGQTGRGWFQVNFGNEDLAAMLAAVGSQPRVFDIRMLTPTPAVTTLARGKLDFLRPDSNPVQ